MDPTLRSRFNASFSDAHYDEYKKELSRRLNTRFEFRLAETPVFFSTELRERFVDAARGIMAQLMAPTRRVQMKRAIPAEWNVPGMDSLPSFAQMDLAVVRDEQEGLVPRLVELQGFPSLTALQVIQRDVWAEVLDKVMGPGQYWSCWFSNLDRDGFLRLARRTIVGPHDPENVILMDLDPLSQKTFPDFAATRQLFGVDAVCPTALIKRGRQLFRPLPGRNGAWAPVKRIYNRVVFDELIRKGVRLPFDYKEELEVEWTPHPNWFWTWSKYSLPFLDHPVVPRTTLISDLKAIPEDLPHRYVLKPLFSFAGGGVKVEPQPEDIVKIPEEEKGSWCLQEKIAYEPALRAADGEGVKVEVRMMFLRPDDEPAPILAQNLCRLSRGLMMGVDYNRAFSWVGSSIGLWPEPPR